MDKRIAILFIVLTAMLPVIIFANENVNVKYDSGVTVYLNSNNILFDLPIVLINENTYVSLREAAEEIDLNVKWNENDREVILIENEYNFDIYKMFENLFGFRLSDEAEILNYKYNTEKEHYLIAKVIISEEDVETIKNLNWHMIDEDYVSSYYTIFSYYAEEFKWWDLLSIKDTEFSYEKFKSGVYKKTVTANLFITKGEDGKYYLYAEYS